MTLFWCCHREETPGGGWQLKIWSLMSPDVPWFLCFKIYSGKSGISFHQTTSDLSHLGGDPVGGQVLPAHQTVFLNQCLIFHYSNSQPIRGFHTAYWPIRSPHWTSQSKSRMSETAKKCLLVFPRLQRGPGQAPSVQISILIWAEQALGRHRRKHININ